MKKILFLLFAVMFIGSSCDNLPNATYSEYITIYEDQWRWDDAEDYFYCEVYIPELTKSVLKDGIITTFYVATIGKTEVMYPLPYDYYAIDKAGYRWTEQSTCEIRPGYITFITKHNTRDYSIRPPKLVFKVNMMW